MILKDTYKELMYICDIEGTCCIFLRTSKVKWGALPTDIKQNSLNLSKLNFSIKHNIFAQNISNSDGHKLWQQLFKALLPTIYNNYTVKYLNFIQRCISKQCKIWGKTKLRDKWLLCVQRFNLYGSHGDEKEKIYT